MTHRGLVGKTVSFVLIAIAVMTIGLSSEPLNAVQVQAVLPAQPLIEPVAMIQRDTEERARQIECLARNIYFEARGEPVAGQIAVGLVTINRVRSSVFPDTICDVVHQRHQFSWAWDKIPDKISQPEVYDRLYALSSLLYDNYYEDAVFPDIVDGATHFHTPEVNPQWRGKKLVVRIGNHGFYTVGG